jgi:hypothetical protein
MESQQKGRWRNILKDPNDQCMARCGRQLMESGGGEEGEVGG